MFPPSTNLPFGPSNSTLHLPPLKYALPLFLRLMALLFVPAISALNVPSSRVNVVFALSKWTPTSSFVQFFFADSTLTFPPV